MDKLTKDLACFDSTGLEQLEEDQIRNEALESGKDLRQYACEIEARLRKSEDASLHEYLGCGEELCQFHEQVETCDGILEKMNEMLQSFQSNLGNISSEITWLQRQSANMSIKLKNRQAVRGELSQYINELVVPEPMINHILDTPVADRHFVEQLHELNHKINFAKHQAFKDARSAHDVREALAKLRMHSTYKIREFLMHRIQEFKKPMGNYQMGQNALLKYRFFYEFLLNNERNVAREVLDEYSDTIAKVHYSYFKEYHHKLMKLQNEDVPQKDDLIGVDEHSKSKAFSFAMINTAAFTSSLSQTLGNMSGGGANLSKAKSKTSVFSLNNRDHILKGGVVDETTIVIPHAASQSGEKYPYEALFRSLQWALVENASREYFFLTDFFLMTGKGVMELFNSIWGKTFMMMLKNIEEHVSASYDAIGLFLCVQVCFKLKQNVSKKDITVLDNYLRSCADIILPRLQTLLYLHTQSLQQLEPSRLNIDVTPHFMSRRFAEFITSFTAIRIENASDEDEVFVAMIQRLKQDMDGVLLRMAAEFSERKHQLVFLINNYDMISSVMLERLHSTSAGAEPKEYSAVRDSLNSHINSFVEELLQRKFGLMVEFVKKGERMLEKNDANAMKKVEPEKILSLVRAFNTHWKKAVEEMNSEIMTSFSNFKNGTNILQVALTQLIQYYHRFSKLLSMAPYSEVTAAKTELLNLHHLMVELKKYKAQF